MLTDTLVNLAMLAPRCRGTILFSMGIIDYYQCLQQFWLLSGTAPSVSGVVSDVASCHEDGIVASTESFSLSSPPHPSLRV